MTGLALIFFVLFGLSIVAIYIGVRRQWAPIRQMTLGGAGASILLMILFSLSQGNGLAQAIVVGFLVGGIFVAATVSIASFFRNSEARGEARPPRHGG